MRNKKHFPSLMVVTNKEHALWYKVLDNKVKEMGEYKTDHPKFSDNEGYFEKGAKSGNTGTSKTFGSGSVREEGPHEMHAAEEHLKEVVKHTRELWDKNSYEHLMVAAPSQLKNFVKDRIKKGKLNNNYKQISGNYTHADKDTLHKLAKDSLKAFKE